MTAAEAQAVIEELRADLAGGRMTVEDLVLNLSEKAYNRALDEAEAADGVFTAAILHKHLWAMGTTIAQVLQHHAPGPVARA